MLLIVSLVAECCRLLLEILSYFDCLYCFFEYLLVLLIVFDWSWLLLVVDDCVRLVLIVLGLC